jgi:hypothetical protein
MATSLCLGFLSDFASLAAHTTLSLRKILKHRHSFHAFSLPCLRLTLVVIIDFAAHFFYTFSPSLFDVSHNFSSLLFLQNTLHRHDGVCSVRGCCSCSSLHRQDCFMIPQGCSLDVLPAALFLLVKEVKKCLIPFYNDVSDNFFNSHENLMLLQRGGKFFISGLHRRAAHGVAVMKTLSTQSSLLRSR